MSSSSSLTAFGHTQSRHTCGISSTTDQTARLDDQFAPFIQPLFGTGAETLEGNYFNGTIFRFPLRMQAGQSDL